MITYEVKVVTKTTRTVVNEWLDIYFVSAPSLLAAVRDVMVQARKEWGKEIRICSIREIEGSII